MSFRKFYKLESFASLMNIVQEIKNFVENECKKPSSKYGYEPYWRKSC